MVRFGIPDYPVFLSRGPSVLLVADVFVMVVSCIAAFVAMSRTTLPKEDKVSTSSVEAPRAQALLARPGSKVSNNTLADDDPDLLNFGATESEIVCWMSS
jgi:hypothetical protein